MRGRRMARPGGQMCRPGGGQMARPSGASELCILLCHRRRQPRHVRISRRCQREEIDLRDVNGGILIAEKVFDL